MLLYPLLSAQTRALLPAQLDSIVTAIAATVALQATESETAFEALVTHHKLKHLWPVFQALDGQQHLYLPSCWELTTPQ